MNRGHFKDTFNTCLNILFATEMFCHTIEWTQQKSFRENSIQSFYMFWYGLVSTGSLNPIPIRFFLAAQVYGSFVINYITAIIVGKHILLPTNSDDFHTKTSTQSPDQNLHNCALMETSWGWDWGHLKGFRNVTRHPLFGHVTILLSRNKTAKSYKWLSI